MSTLCEMETLPSDIHLNNYFAFQDNPINRVDPLGLAADPIDSPYIDINPPSNSPSYGNVFTTDGNFFSAPAASLDTMLLGESDKPAASITLPQALELAISEAVKETQKDGVEHGGVITASGKAPNLSLQVWGPVAGTAVAGKKGGLVDVQGSYPGDDANMAKIGYYHAHPEKNGPLHQDSFTVFSPEDIASFLGNYVFALMTNCNGSETTAVVALKSINRNVVAKHYNAALPFIDVGSNETRQYQDWENMEMNTLAYVGKDDGFAVYRRTTADGALKLVQYDSKAPTETSR